MVVTVAAARGRGITSAPTPAKARLGLCAVEHTTHSSDTQKRACSQHIYILYNIYIEGYTGLYTNLALSPPTSQGGCVAVPESHGGGLSGMAAYLLGEARPSLKLPDRAPTVGWKTGNGTNRSCRAPPQASPRQGQNGLSQARHSPGQICAMCWAEPPPLGLYRKAWSVSHRPRSQQPLPGAQLTCQVFFRTCRGFAPRPRPCALGPATPWPVFAKPGPGFLCNLGLMPAPKAAGT